MRYSFAATFSPESGVRKCSSIATTRIRPAVLARAPAEKRPQPGAHARLRHGHVVGDDALRRAFAAHRTIFEAQLLFAAAHGSEVEAFFVARPLGNDRAHGRLGKPPFVLAAGIRGEGAPR